MKFMVRIVATLVVLGAGLAHAIDPPKTLLPDYFGYSVDIDGDVPATDDALSLITVSVEAPETIRRPEVARFVIAGEEYAEYHYKGFSDGTHDYIVAIPNTYSGTVGVVGHFDDRSGAVSQAPYYKSEEDLTSNTVVLGANDIILLVDTSGSMATNNRMAITQNAVNDLVPALMAEGNNVAVLGYDGYVTFNKHFIDDFAPLSFSAGGGTATAPALRTARSMLSGRNSAGKIVMVLTDGVPNSRSATDDAIFGLVSDGVVVVGMGIDINVASTYPIRKRINSGDSAFDSEILNLVKTAEESIRDVSSFCRDGQCKAVDNDTTKPESTIEFQQSCKNMASPWDLKIGLHDSPAGLDPSATDVLVKFADGSIYSYPTIHDDADVMSQRAAISLLPHDMLLLGDENSIVGTPSLMEQFDSSFSLPVSEGGKQPFEIIVKAADGDGQTLSRTFSVSPIIDEDTSSPLVELQTGGHGSSIRNIADFAVVVSDDRVGVQAETISIKVAYEGEETYRSLGGSTSGELYHDDCIAQLPLRYQFDPQEGSMSGSDVMSIMSKAYSDSKPVQITVFAEDFNGNFRNASIDMDIAPEVFEGNPVSVPAVNQSFMGFGKNNTYQVFPEDIVFEDTESVFYFAQLKSASDQPITVNGKSITYGSSVNLGQFDLHKPLEFNIQATGSVEGAATLVLLSSNPDVRAIEIPVDLWRVNAVPEVSSWTPVQVFERVSVDVRQGRAGACRLTSKFSEALSADQVSDPVCLVEFDRLPKDMFGYTDGQARATGFIPDTGEHEIGFKVSLYDPNGNKHLMDEGEVIVSVQKAADYMEFGFVGFTSPMNRVVEEVEGRLVQTQGPLCSEITLSRNRAMDQGALNKPACLVEWQVLPNGIEEDKGQDNPEIFGVFEQQVGDAVFEIKFSSFTTGGEFVELFSKTITIDLSDPPAPTISVSPEREVGGSMLAVSTEGGEAGTVTVSTVNADVIVEVSRNGSIVSTNEVLSGFGDSLEYQQRINVGAADLWTLEKYTVSAKYARLPALKTTLNFNVVSVPDPNITPELSLDHSELMSSETADVLAQMSNRRNTVESYDPATMGNWDIRIVNEFSYGQFQEVAPFVSAGGDGQAEFSVDFENSSEVLKLYGESFLKAPYEELDLTVRSSRPTYLTVLNAGPIGSEIDARNAVGEAPVTVMANVKALNRRDTPLMGDIVWEVRDVDAGRAWEVVESPYGDRIYRSFDEGNYQLRARTFNSLSNVEYVTEIVNVVAYKKPEIALDAPRNAFIGDTAVARLVAREEGAAIDFENLEIEWSQDGENWVEGGEAFEVTSDTRERVDVYVRVKPKSTPEGIRNLHTELSTRVAFQDAKPPRARIYGESRLEVGTPTTFEVASRTPYYDMDVEVEGYFLMPDGTKQTGTKVTYVPTLADTELERPVVTYVSWVKGYEGLMEPTHTQKRLRVWDYQWPTWGVSMQATTLQAPAEVTLRARTIAGRSRYLEGLTFRWEIPGQVEVEQDRYDERRDLVFNEPGTYSVRLFVSDDRGNEDVLYKTIEVTEPDPWEVDFQVRYSNENHTAPLGVYMRPNVLGGHPEDRAHNFEYLINGVPHAEGRFMKADLEEGTNVVEMQFDTYFGERVARSLEIDVLPNIPPTCELLVRAYSSRSGDRWRLTSDCQDMGGEISSLTWTVDGEELPFGSRRIMLKVEDGEVRPTATLQATDNGGLKSETIVW